MSGNGTGIDGSRIDGLRRRNIIRHEKILGQLLRRIGAVALEIRHAAFGEKIIVDEKPSRELARRRGKHA